MKIKKKGLIEALRILEKTGRVYQARKKLGFQSREPTRFGKNIKEQERIQK